MVVAEALVLVFALAVAVVRGLPGRGAKPLRALMIAYTDFIGLQKDTALVSVIGVAEAALQSQAYSQTYANFTSYTVAAVLFVLLTIPLARFTDHLILTRERRERAGAT